jgi:serine protease Do
MTKPTRQGIHFALLSACLVGGLAAGVIVTAFLRPHTARQWLSQLASSRHWFSRVRTNAEIVALVNRGVVTVIATRALPENEIAASANDPNAPLKRGTGTGFVIDPLGFIVTNEHVIRAADRIRVKLNDGREFSAAIHGADAATDLALLKIEADQLTPLPFGDSDRVNVGDAVLAIGNPLEYAHSVTAGIVSAKGRKVYYNEPYEDFIQTDAAINRGNSGGPLFNQWGEVIGVNTVIRIDSRGISFAIPSNVTRRVVAQLRTQGAVVRGYLGLTPQPLTPEFREGLGAINAAGILVAAVAPDTPAAQAGLQPYDILTSFDGRTLTNIDDFYSVVAATPPRQQVKLAVVRNGQPLELTATLGERPRNESERTTERPASLVKERAALGFTVKPRTAANESTAREIGALEIADVDPLGPAAESGLAVSQLLLEFNRQPVATIEAFQRFAADLKPEQVVILRVRTPAESNARLIAIRLGK